jgi:hypothetical protein
MAQIDITKEKKGMLEHALAGAEPGDEIVYHYGLQAGGKHRSDAFDAYQGGRCFLYQRRIGEGMFSYIARKPQQ